MPWSTAPTAAGKVHQLEVTIRLDHAGWRSLIARAEAAMAKATLPDELIDVPVRGFARPR